MEKKVYIIIESKSEDYHGRYDTIISVHADYQLAMDKCDRLKKQNYNPNIEYCVDTYEITS